MTQGARIHASAVVEDGARLGAGVVIGPFCHVGPNVDLGEGVELKSHVVVAGRTSIGARTRVFPFASLGHEPQDLKFRGEETSLAIGADCLIREGVTMNPGTAGGRSATIVGDRCAFLANSHVGHDCEVGNDCVFSNNVMLAGHVTIGDFVICGGGSAIVQFARIGSHAFVSGLTGITADLIPFGLAFGNRGISDGAQSRRLEAPQFFARSHPRVAPRLSRPVRAGRHAEGADGGRRRRASPTMPRSRKSSISSAPEATGSFACRNSGKIWRERQGRPDLWRRPVSHRRRPRGAGARLRGFPARPARHSGQGSRGIPACLGWRRPARRRHARNFLPRHPGCLLHRRPRTARAFRTAPRLGRDQAGFPR